MPDPHPTRDRVAAHRRRVLEAGGRRLMVMLTPDAAAALVALQAALGMPSERATLLRVLADAAARLTSATR